MHIIFPCPTTRARAAARMSAIPRILALRRLWRLQPSAPGRKCRLSAKGGGINVIVTTSCTLATFRNEVNAYKIIRPVFSRRVKTDSPKSTEEMHWEWDLHIRRATVSQLTCEIQWFRFVSSRYLKDFAYTSTLRDVMAHWLESMPFDWRVALATT